jgi:flavin-dependent dehydrogenase
MKVCIVGLGTAGSAVAWACAARGLSVVGVERGDLQEAGARWVNGVPRWAFGEAGLPEPVAPELRAAEGRFHLVGGHGPERVLLRSALEVDMRHLVARLQRAAREAGAELRGGVRAHRLQGSRLETDQGSIEADVWVDASGASGLRLLGTPEVAREDWCAAAQEVREIRDRPGAERFLAQWGAQEDEVVCFSGIEGGYSIVNVRVSGHEVGLLTGTLPGLGHRGGLALLRDFVEQQPWIGGTVFGGSRAIPLRRPWEVVGMGPVAAVGDAAGQVYAAHGSGIAQELLAARLLADALAEGRGCWGYNVAWQRRLGALLAGSDLFRRFSATLAPDSVRGLMRRGVLSAPLMADAMEQRPVRPPLGSIVRAGAGLLRSPRLGSALLPVLARMRALEWTYAAYPQDTQQLPGWLAQLRRVSGLPGWMPGDS